jgi:hypothetical protein
MNASQCIVVSTLILALILATNKYAVASSPQQYFGDGGEITGYVLGVNNRPIDWAVIYARSTQHTYESFSGMSGLYQMRAPTGTYNVTVNASGYNAASTNVTVSINSSTIANFYLAAMNVSVPGGSSSIINIYLTQTQVPEFQPSLSLTLVALTLAITLVLRKSTRH